MNKFLSPRFQAAIQFDLRSWQRGAKYPEEATAICARIHFASFPRRCIPQQHERLSRRHARGRVQWIESRLGRATPLFELLDHGCGRSDEFGANVSRIRRHHALADKVHANGRGRTFRNPALYDEPGAFVRNG